MGDGSIQMIIASFICLILSGLFSAADTAFTGFNRTRMKKLATEGDKRAILVVKYTEDLDSLVSVILILKSIANITLAAVITLLYINIFSTNGIWLSILITSASLIFLGEITPRSIAKEVPDSYCKSIAPLISIFVLILKPLSFILRKWRKLLSRIFKSNTPKADSASTMIEDELITMVDEVEQDGGLNESEGDLIRSAIEFVDADVEDIITPRVDVVAIDKDTPVSEIGAIFRKTGFSRLPVYNETIDDIIGVLHEKDFYYLNLEGGKEITSILSKALYVSCHVKISKLLALFQQEKAHMAIVLDDYGGTMGIATLEDVLEELVGDIWDEHDEVVELFTENPDGSVTISGNARTFDMFDYFDIEPDDEDELPQTVNGWVTLQFGSFPEKGASFDFGKLHVIVTKTDEKTVDEITVTIFDPVQKSNDDKIHN